MNWFGKPVPQNRFLGEVNQDDPTNLPMGLASVCEEWDFTRDSGGPTCATTRAGFNTSMQCRDAAAPVTGAIGFLYEPESATDPFFQMPLVFQPSIGSQYEFPVGTGRMVAFPATNFAEPLNVGAHAIDASAGNNVFRAYSNLKTPLGTSMATLSPKNKTMNPFGMKPFGFNWQPATWVNQGEVVTPSSPTTGNGHTYQAQNSGWTALAAGDEPDWPLNENGEVTEAPVGPGQAAVTWKEHTMVIANRLAPPNAPALALAGGGTIAAAMDVYVLLTLVNMEGESLPSLAAKITTLAAATTVTAQVPALAALPGWEQTLAAQYVPTGANVYVAIVATASPAPAVADYAQFGGTVALGTLVDITAAGGGAAPPTSSTARVTPGQLPTPTTQPVVDRDPGAGTFPAGRDVYVGMTYTNTLGETPMGPANSVPNTNLDDAVQVTVAVPLGPQNEQLYTIASVGIYEADVATGQPAPPASQFRLVGYYQPGDTPSIGASAAGVNPPLTNTTGPGGSIAADTSTGGANGTQGYRYAACLWINQNQTISGFSLASVVSTIIDEDGWEIGVFNVPLGMPNVVGRIIAFTIADGTQAGPFAWLGLVDLFAPSQNIVYPDVTPVDGVNQSATVILDNVTTQATFNFTDSFLTAEATGNNVDDRLDVAIPPQGCRVDYLASVDRLAVTGVPGLASGVWISLGEDYESFYADDSPVPITTNGEVCYGVTDKYKGALFALMSESGFVLSANTGNPNSWAATRRWQGYGPCGFRAWDANGKMIIFAHRSGLYRYAESDPDLMSKEVPKRWAAINWAAADTISVTIDEDTHTVRVLVPTDNSPVPNYEYVLSYIEGWQNPIHFSTFSGKEISMDAARRWSFNKTIAAFMCVRMIRTLPLNAAAFLNGPSWNTMPDSSFGLSQLLYASSGQDGTVQARTPGIFSDNGAGIPGVYRGMSYGLMQAVCKPEGFNLNACGQGSLVGGFLAARAQDSDQGGVPGLEIVDEYVPFDPVILTPRQIAGITRRVEPAVNEFWSWEAKLDGQPGTWCSLKALTPYMIPFTVGRDAADKQG